MTTNQLFWSVHQKIIKQLKEESEATQDYDLPISSKVFLLEFEDIVKGYLVLKEFVDTSTGFHNLPGKTSGLYVEAFCQGISIVLSDFNQSLLELDESFLCNSSVSMLEIFDKIGQSKDILPVLNLAVNQIKTGKFRGCKILDLCEYYIFSYPTVIERVFKKIQQLCLKQFYKQTKLWIMQGLLYDPYSEFFIIPAEMSSDLDQTTLSSVTTGTTMSHATNFGGPQVFQVRSDNLPDLIPNVIAKKIHFIGETVTVCQHNEAGSRSNDRILSVCGISEQNIAAQLSEIEKSDFFPLQKFSCIIDDLWIGVNKYICQICNEIGNVKGQLVLMWEMFLLGRGELFQEFLLKGSHLLNTDVTKVDSRSLNNIFKDAVYYVYLSEYSDLTDLFVFKLPNRKSVRQGVKTWTVMRLKYKVKWPLYNLFSRDVMLSYNKLFIFLLKLKKAQYDVTSTWKGINSINNHSLRMDLIEIRMKLLAIVGNLQNYCSSNVIASEMTTLLESVKNAALFTDLQEALLLFLMNINNNIFFPSDSFTRCSAFDKSIESLESVFFTVFSLCKSFSELSENNEENLTIKLIPLKKKVESSIRKLFLLLNNIDKTCYDGGKTSSHLYNLMMCLDYNRFFRNKFEMSSLD